MLSSEHGSEVTPLGFIVLEIEAKELSDNGGEEGRSPSAIAFSILSCELRSAIVTLMMT
jgi:hypothetical protein